MRRALCLLAVLLAAAAAAPGALAAGGTAVASVDLAGAGGSAGKRFTLAGIHWQGSGRVAFRTRSLDGRWSGWRPAAPEEGDGPNRASTELRPRAGWKIGSPWWVGPSDRIETRTSGSVARVRAYLVWSPETRVPIRVPSATDTPAIVPRLSWGASESIRRAPPSYAPSVRFAVVHHTAGRTDYSRAQAPAIVKAIQLYHVQGNGWNDIGYNFLVDRFGTVYEGRFGGADRNVIGAHARGFNTGSVGVALLGTYGSASPSQAAQDAIARLLAWRLDLAHVDPTSFVTAISGGNERYADGLPVLLGAVSGHRDTGFTECPGNALYAKLGSLAAAAKALGLPKIFEPRVDVVETAVRFRARLSSSLAWTVAVVSAGGVEVGRGSGRGAVVDWTWDSAAAAAGTYTWTIQAGTARVATGVLRAGTAAQPLAIQGVAAEPAAISPNGDGQADVAVVTYRLTAAASVSVEVLDTSGTLVATVVDRVWTRAGQNTATIDGATLADGRYDVAITARTPTGAEARQVIPITVSRMLGFVSADPSVFSPNGDGRNDRLTVAFGLAAPAEVRIRILREGRWVASPYASSLQPGEHRFVWDGRRAAGPLRDGAYVASVDVTDAVTSISFAVPFVSDTTAPLVRILPGRPLRVEVSEPAALTLRIDGAIRTREVRRAGVVRIPWGGAANRVRAVARDAAGNTSSPALRISRPGQ